MIIDTPFRDDEQNESESCDCWSSFNKCKQTVNGKSWNIDETKGVIEFELNNHDACARACEYSPEGM